MASGLSESDLTELLKLQFCMVAETLGQIAAFSDGRTAIKMKGVVEGFEVGAAMYARAAAPLEAGQ